MEQYFVFCQSDLVLEKDGDVLRIPTEPPVELKPWTNVLHVAAAKAYRIDQPLTDNPRYEMCGLRQSYYHLSSHDYLLAGKCHELLYWDGNTKFCGVCGAPMQFHTDISKRCTQCGKEVWPQLATAVIVLVSRGDEVLLVHAKNFRGDFYGLVAGFVETGETLEEAVCREVMEETGLTIKNLHYYGSQPWPYPCGLMVGFLAEYDNGDIHLQQSELSRGAWFNRHHLPQIPEKLSIARQIIDYWLNLKSKEDSNKQ